MLLLNRLKDLEEQYTKEKMEHERMFAQQREVYIYAHLFMFDLHKQRRSMYSSKEFVFGYFS